MAFLFDSEIDFSFAICPRRRRDEDDQEKLEDYEVDSNEHQQHLLCNSEERTSVYLEYEVGRNNEQQPSATDEETISTSSIDSNRSVTFAENIVSEVKVVPRYERERVSELFYNRFDIMRFRQERRLERMQVHVIW